MLSLIIGDHALHGRGWFPESPISEDYCLVFASKKFGDNSEADDTQENKGANTNEEWEEIAKRRSDSSRSSWNSGFSRFSGRRGRSKRWGGSNWGGVDWLGHWRGRVWCLVERLGFVVFGRIWKFGHDSIISEMKKIKQEIVNYAMGAVMGVVVLVGILMVTGRDRVMPGVSVVGIAVGQMSEDEVRGGLRDKVESYTPKLQYGEAVIEVPRVVSAPQIEATIEKIMAVGRRNVRDWWRALFREHEMEMEVSIDEEEIANMIDELKEMIEIEGEEGSIESVWGEIKLVNGEDEVKLDEGAVREVMIKSARSLDSKPQEIRTLRKRNALTESEVDELMEKAKKIVSGEMVIMIDEARVVMRGSEMVEMLSVNHVDLGQAKREKLESKISEWGEKYNREPQDAVFQFLNEVVEEFVPARDGVEIDQEVALQQLESKIEELMESEEKSVEVTIALIRTKPLITTEEVNSLGIVERIGKGESYYAHSIPNRVYNVGVASERVSGALVGPGEEFSFNSQVGEISKATGYKTAYVISNGRTELGDGGGVCQVSTTVFRAALSAGLPITERWAHAYRVGYYEQNSKPGFDATIYSPSKDLQFLNDTPSHILVQAVIDEPSRHLVIEIYGTADGREAFLSEARVWGVSPPPPDLYQDDPTLPTGVVKQVDWSAWGARAAFDYRVERDGEVIMSKTFSSTFRPWQNVYLRGTGE